MCLELGGDYVWGGWISWPPGWDLQLWRLFSSLRAGAHSPSLLPQENGGEPRPSSVSEIPSSPTPLAVSPNASETHSKVGLGLPGGGGGWKAESGLSPPCGAVQEGHTVQLTLPLIPKLAHRRMTNAIQHLAPSWTLTSRWLWPRSGRTRSAPARGHPRWTGARKMNCSATCEGPEAG